jgi:hypothetical protein
MNSNLLGHLAIKLGTHEELWVTDPTVRMQTPWPDVVAEMPPEPIESQGDIF